jgi:hypothetical protein
MPITDQEKASSLGVDRRLIIDRAVPETEDDPKLDLVSVSHLRYFSGSEDCPGVP